MCPRTFSDGGDVSPHFFRRGGHNMPCPSHFFLFRFFIWRGFKSKSGVCHVLCEELFMINGRPYIANQVDVETEFGVVSMILFVYEF